MKTGNFFAELKRRNVVRMAGLYLVGAWLLTQVASTVLPMFGAPDWMPRSIVILLAIGFVPALIFSWVFELTPQGLKRDEDVAPEQSIAPQTARRMDRMIIGVLVLALGYFAIDKFVLTPRREAGMVAASASPNEQKAAIPEKSIAVLPFENLSDEKANAYFADGVQNKILTRLSKIADLKVISHTSMQHYKSTPENLTEIAKELAVANIVEGSVQKSGDSVRVNVQLIKAANDSHLWADTFDRKLTDIFSVESEVAKAIADHLRAKLTGQEEQVIAAKPTDNPEAYDAYLRGLAYTLKAEITPANALGAQKYLREAVRLDPKFAVAWAELASAESFGYYTLTLQPTVALREEIRHAAETASSLQPHLGEAIFAKGEYYSNCLKDFDTAVGYFERARQLLPNNSRILQELARASRSQGRWDRCDAYFNEAERVDPRNVAMLTQRAFSYIARRRFSEALRKLDQVLNITPDDPYALALKAGVALMQGDLPHAAALLAPLHPNPDQTQVLEIQIYYAILARRTDQIIVRLKEALAEPDPALGYLNGELRFCLGWAQEVALQHAAARETWRQARSELESFLKEQPDNWVVISDLALTNAFLGDKAAALALAERVVAENRWRKIRTLPRERLRLSREWQRRQVKPIVPLPRYKSCFLRRVAPGSESLCR